jgi:hypothetical protein
MGCGGSKANKGAEPKAFDKTLAKEPAGKPNEAIVIYMDSFGIADCLKADESKKSLQIDNVIGGPIGLWNNRGRTEKVAKGDSIERVRRVQPKDSKEAEWVSGDAEKMMSVLQGDGVFEAEVRRKAQQPQQPPQEKQPDSATEPTQPSQPVQETEPANPVAESTTEAKAAESSSATDEAPENKVEEAQAEPSAKDEEPPVTSAEADTTESAGAVDAKDSSCGIFC